MRVQIVRLEKHFRGATPLSWIKTEGLFLYAFHWIAIHFLIRFLPFNYFAVCCSFSIIRTAWMKFIAFVFSCLFTALYSRWKSELILLENMREFSSVLTTDSSAVYYKCKGYSDICSSGLVKKKKWKENWAHGNTRVPSWLDFSFRSSLKDRNTDTRNRNL